VRKSEVMARRCCLVVPASSERMLKKAFGLVVDEVVLDFEDALSSADKTPELRTRVAAMVREATWRAPIVAVRVNAVETPWFRDDLSQLMEEAGGCVRSVVVPKVESATQVVAVHELLAELEAKFALAPVAVEAQIETALGLVKVDEIAASSSRLVALIFGAGDFAASMGLSQPVIGAGLPGYVGDRWQYARSRIATAAHAYGLTPVDTPYAAFEDINGLVETARQARALGFLGKWVIHPAQIEACRDLFTPTVSELDDARRILEVLDRAAEVRRGADADGAVMVDEASRRVALAVLARAPAD
jgi:citrate lyase subunit beta / citryl-CoA lyase